MVGRETVTFASDLHIGLVLRPFVNAHHQRKAGHSFTSDYPDFESMLAVGDDRGEAALGEVDMRNPLVARVQLLPHRKVNCFKVGFEQAEVGPR